MVTATSPAAATTAPLQIDGYPSHPRPPSEGGPALCQRWIRLHTVRMARFLAAPLRSRRKDAARNAAAARNTKDALKTLQGRFKDIYVAALMPAPADWLPCCPHHAGWYIYTESCYTTLEGEGEGEVMALLWGEGIRSVGTPVAAQPFVAAPADQSAHRRPRRVPNRCRTTDFACCHNFHPVQL